MSPANTSCAHGHTRSWQLTRDSTRSFLKRPGRANIPIQAIGLSLYEQLPTSHSSTTNATPADSVNGTVTTADPDIEQPGTKVTRTQWLDLSSLEMENLIGKNILIVDEVDDTRTTLEYAVRELMKDVEEARKKSGRGQEEGRTTFSVFVLHVSLDDGLTDRSSTGTVRGPRGLLTYMRHLQNKDKNKRGNLPSEMLDQKRYLAAVTGM